MILNKYYKSLCLVNINFYRGLKLIRYLFHILHVVSNHYRTAVVHILRPVIATFQIDLGF